MTEFEKYLKKAGDSHGHICAGIALGTKMTLAAMKILGLNPNVRNKNLIVYAEIDRCMTDAVQSITGCSLGHRSLKHVDYGKFAATYVNLDTGRAVRATIRGNFNSSDDIDEVCKIINETPDENMVILQKVELDIPQTDLPGFPVNDAQCAVCGERIMDGRAVLQDDKTLCRGCAYGTYYTIQRSKHAEE